MGWSPQLNFRGYQIQLDEQGRGQALRQSCLWSQLSAQFLPGESTTDLHALSPYRDHCSTVGGAFMGALLLAAQSSNSLQMNNSSPIV